MKPIRSFDDLPDVRHTYEYCADLAAILMPEVNDHAKPFDLESTKPLAAIIDTRPRQWNRRRRAREETSGLARPNDHGKPNRT